MPYYYFVDSQATTNATPGTENAADLAVRTAANQESFVITTVSGSARSPSGTSLAGAAVRFKTFATASTGGSAAALRKANPNNPAQAASVLTGATTGATPTVALTVGFAAPGGAGGWMAIESDAGLKLLPNAGANGNLETSTVAGLASIVLEYTVQFKEG
jgi:hypothetical protein